MSKNLIIVAISIGFLSYVAIALYLYFFQEKILFRNDLAPKEVDLPKEVKIIDLDGIEVGFLDRNAPTTTFYFGGNANNALEFFTIAKDFDANVVIMNYPGYGHSKGTPSQEAIFQSALKVFEKFQNRHNVVIGRSLGTGVASFIASKKAVDRVILITPFHSIAHLAKLRYPFFPTSFILKHPFESYKYLQKTNAPIYIILAQQDTTTPPKTLKKLLPYINNLQGIYTIKGSHHNDILEFEETKKILLSILG